MNESDWYFAFWSVIDLNYTGQQQQHLYEEGQRIADLYVTA